MTLQYGKEYADNISLVGEPGNFRFSKNKEAAASQAKGQLQPLGTATPNQSRAVSMVPAVASPAAGPGKAPKMGEKNFSMPDGATKVKRRKSKAGDASP